jgi:predicted dehydrogenase
VSGPSIDYEVHGGDGHVERPRPAPVNPWVAQLVDFMHAAQGSVESPFASGEDGRRSLAVCLAIEEAAKTGREIVL